MFYFYHDGVALFVRFCSTNALHKIFHLQYSFLTKWIWLQKLDLRTYSYVAKSSTYCRVRTWTGLSAQGVDGRVAWRGCSPAATGSTARKWCAPGQTQGPQDRAPPAAGSHPRTGDPLPTRINITTRYTLLLIQ